VLSRRGTTLVELLVALVLSAVLLGAASSSLLRQQRAARWVGASSAAESQVRHVARLLSGELALLDAESGDVAAGQASDSSLELRAVVASGLACDTATNVVALAPPGLTTPPLSGVARAPAPGDSLWYDADSLGWRGRAVLAVARASAGCTLPAATAGATYRLTLDAPIDASGATPVRLTRWERYVVYRASDGRWYVGIRDWSVASARYLAPQPVAGPFLRALPSGERTGFRFYDSLGMPLILDGTNERAIARVRITALTLVPALTTRDSVRRDSADVALARRASS
jgi:prepilin-type N-terminal cleavage/methylation domain-containing protein